MATVQWYPGHMTKAKREMIEKIKTVDMVIEIRDSRIPEASKNPMIEQLCQNKPRLILLSKKDKADEISTKKWITALSDENTSVLAVDLINDNVVVLITKACKEIMQVKIDRMIRKGIRPRAVRAMVVGIPNVGKSTMINRIAKRKIAKTADRPGVTQSLQWIKLNQDLELLDTPGVLWPKFENQEIAYLLAMSGAIRDEILPFEEVAVFAMNKMIQDYPTRLCERYNIELNEDPYVIFQMIADQRLFYLEGKQMDLKRTMDHFINELRNDKFGPITWELPR